jgi:Fe2+ transport system protein B
MIDPITIGIAFTVAQKTVGGIKQAIALGKDINSLYGQFARFFENSDQVHSTSAQLQSKADTLTDGQIRALSIQIAMQSKALRDAEKELKELLIWTGNKDVWDQMMAERVRMYKERRERERKLKEAREKAHTEMIDRVLISTGFMGIMVPAVLFTFTFVVR